MWYNKKYIWSLSPFLANSCETLSERNLCYANKVSLNGALDSFRMGIVPREIHPVTVNIGLKLWASPPFRLSAQQPAFQQRWTRYFLKLSQWVPSHLLTPGFCVVVTHFLYKHCPHSGQSPSLCLFMWMFFGYLNGNRPVSSSSSESRWK